MAKKCYAVRKGNRIGIFYSWDECQSAVLGYSGAEYKGFNTEKEAELFLKGGQSDTSKGSQLGTFKGAKIEIKRPASAHAVNVYTDGSFKNKKVSFGVYLEATVKNFSFYGTVSCPQYSNIANIAGELLGVLTGVQLAKDMGYTRINILYDYAGIERWYNGDWNAKGELQSIYRTLLNNLRLQHDLTLNFIQVKGHSNVEGNKRADKLATRASNFNQYVDIDAILRGTLTVMDVPRV